MAPRCPFFPPARRAARGALLAAVLALPTAPGGAQPARAAAAARACAPAAAAAVRAGWERHRAGDVAAATARFDAALALCPAHAEAHTGAGYSALRGGRVEAARAHFARVLASHPRDLDALAGAGMAAYHAGDLAATRRSFERVLALAPKDSTARWYLARVPEFPDPAQLPRVRRPSATVVGARARHRTFEVPDGRGGWRPMWIKGLNIGAALPGRHPSEFPPDDGTYDGWLRLAAEMGVNTLRVYTVHPPHFYRALERWNRAHPDRPLWLIHGVWTELPPGKQEERYDDAAWGAEFRAETRRVVDLLHGHAAIAPRAGHASGLYTADVSRWVLGYIIGREWEPYSVLAFARAHPADTTYAGRFLQVRRGNAVDVWLARECDELVAYEMATYNAQRPVAYTNWPTLDPLRHPTESTKQEEDALRRARGETVAEASNEFDNDAVDLDAALVAATPAYAAGTFASFHAYPYYPDFMVLDTGYAAARSPEGPSSYYGYLRELVAHHGDMPVLVSEYGVPSSRGLAHFQPQGWHHGGHSEQDQAAVNARLTRDIHAAGAAGAVLFAAIDEWFKKNWVTIDFEQPLERNRLWLNALDAEQNYGVIAMRPGPADSALAVDGKGDDWRGRPALYEGAPPAELPAPLRLRALRVASDEGYVYLRLDVGALDWARGRYLVGIDTYRRELGDTRLPVTGTTAPVGLEFVLDLRGADSSRLLVDAPYNLYRSVPIAGTTPPTQMNVYNRPFRTVANADGRWEPVLVEANRRRIGRDGTVFPRMLHDRSRLLHARQADNSLADWFADPATGCIEVRIPWGMLHVLDPSSRTVLDGGSPDARDPAGAPTDGFRFVVQSYDPRTGAPGDHLPRAAPGGSAAPPTWTWPTWETPRWHAEVKPVFGAMRDAFSAIGDPAPAAAAAAAAGAAEPVRAPRPRSREAPRRSPRAPSRGG